MGIWQEDNVQVFWMEQGSNKECEKALRLPREGSNLNSLVAFKSGLNTYEQIWIEGELTLNVVDDFIMDILEDGFK